jgi:hypothetical protein
MTGGNTMQARISKAILAATLLSAFASTSLLSGCAATTVAIEKRNLDVQTKMSATIFLDPTSDANKTIFVQVRNTSDQPAFDIASDVTAAIVAKGYRVVSDPDKAHFILQANILQVGKADPSVAQLQGFGAYGSTLNAALLGGASVAAFGGRHVGGGAVLGGMLVAGVADTVANALVKDVYYDVVTDVQIREANHNGVVSHEASMHNLAQGTSGGTTVTSNEDSNYHTYQTRVLSVANKVNLDFAEAQQPLRDGLVRAISGVF